MSASNQEEPVQLYAGTTSAADAILQVDHRDRGDPLKVKNLNSFQMHVCALPVLSLAPLVGLVCMCL